MHHFRADYYKTWFPHDWVLTLQTSPCCSSSSSLPRKTSHDPSAIMSSPLWRVRNALFLIPVCSSNRLYIPYCHLPSSQSDISPTVSVHHGLKNTNLINIKCSPLKPRSTGSVINLSSPCPAPNKPCLPASSNVTSNFAIPAVISYRHKKKTPLSLTYRPLT